MKKTIWITGVIGIIIDQLVKIIITNILSINDSIEVIKNTFYITITKNTGGAWGIFSNSTLILVLIALVFIFFFIKFLKKEEEQTIMKQITYGLLLAGIIGNMIDRIIHRYVIDYFHMYVFSYDFPVFNIADILIVISVGLLIIEIIRGEINEHNSK